MIALKKKILVLGDSHAHVFKAGKFSIKFPQYEWSLCYVMGATLLGLGNPNSKTKAMEQYTDKLTEIKPDLIVTLLGEIDIGYHVWFRNKTKEEPIEQTMNKALQSYSDLWRKIKQESNDIICISVPLPTIPDTDKVGDVALSRKFVDASQLDRTKATLLFNQKLRDLAISQGVKYLDLDSESLGEDGLVKDGLMHPNRFDHHYFGLTYSNLLVEKLANFL